MSDKQLKIMTIIGTRPELIRLACVIKKLDKYCKHILVHTGQNFDYELSTAFFEDLEIREPNYQLDTKANSLSLQLANIFTQTGAVLEKERPDAVLVLGDTNSALSVIIAKRMKIPVFHMEAGDRSFDEIVPEESNRKIIDHVADLNLTYTEHSRRNLIREGIHPSRIYVTGSPLSEVYESIKDKIPRSEILDQLKLKRGRYIIASLHREENVESKDRLASLSRTLHMLADKYEMPVVVSTHPRTWKNREKFGMANTIHPRVVWHKPFRLIDYLNLEINSFCAISDSGTIHEDSSILDFPAVAIRNSTEKPESIESGHCGISGIEAEDVLRFVEIIKDDPINRKTSPMPAEYARLNVSGAVTRIILSMTRILDDLVWGRGKL